MDHAVREVEKDGWVPFDPTADLNVVLTTRGPEAGSSILNGRQVPPPSPMDPEEYEPSPTHPRETTSSRGPIVPTSKASSSKPTPTINQTQRSQQSSTTLRSPVVGGPVDRRPSQNYGHARHASKAPTQARNELHPTSPTMGSMSPDSAATLTESSVPPNDFESMSRWPLHRQASKSPSTTQQRWPQHSAASSMTLVEKDMAELTTGTIQKRIERQQSSKQRNDHLHHHSNSRTQQEQKTVGEYSLHHLFNKFLPQADFKIRQCILDQGSRHDTSIELICGQGADPDFDNLIYAMAHITRRKPKPLVDTIMYWRQQRARGSSEPVYDMSSPSGQQVVASRRTAAEDMRPPASDANLEGLSYEDSPYNSEYRVFVAIYLTCRVLIEVFNQADASALSSSMQQKLESIIFERLQSLDPGIFVEHSFKIAIWEIYGRLLGVMSSRMPSSVPTLFVSDLSSSQKELYGSGRAAPPRDLEIRVDMMIRSVRHVHVQTYPENAWRESCVFLCTLADLLVSSHGATLKYAYCNAFVDLLLPVASNWSPSLNTPKYREFHAIINPRVTNIAAKPRHWAEALPTYSVLLCASPDDQFSTNWPITLSTLQTKLKDRSTRAIALQAITRMVWTFLERAREAGSAIRRLEEIMKTVFPTSKKTSFSIDTVACEPLIELIRIIGYHNQEYCFSKIIFPLLNSDLFASGKDIKVEQLDPERMVVGIRAFLLIMTDLENGESGKPQFPRFGAGGISIEGSSMATGTPSTLTSKLIRPSSNLKPFASSKFGPSVRDYYTRFCDILGRITIICDNAFGGQAVLDEKFGTGLTPKTPLADTFTFTRRADDHQGSAEQRLGFYELLHVSVQALPRSLSAHVQLKPLINLLCTCTAHVQSNIAVSSIQSLKSIARQSCAQHVTIGFARFIFNFDARYSTMSEEGLLGPDHIENTLNLYVDLLLIWIEEIRQKTRATGPSTYSDGPTGSRSRQLDLASVTNHVDEVESHGLFFLCSQSRRVRAFAVRVLRIVTEFDVALGRQSHEQPIPRIIHILEGDSQDVMDVNDESLSVAERSRLQKGRYKGTSQPTLIELSSSDVSYDSTLWFKVFPNIIRLSFERCIAVVMLGREIVCARLMQMQETITFLDSGMPPLPFSDANGVRTPHRLHSMSPQVLVEQWKLYLIMACTTVTNTGGQTQSQLDKSQHARKISKPAPPGQDKISSARALFAYVIPLLSASSSAIREAIVVALSSINTNLFRVLLESLQYAVTSCKEDAKNRIGSHYRSGSNPRKTAATDRMRAEVTQIYRLTARFLQEPMILQDDWIVTNLSTYARELMIFLGDSDVQSDWDSQKLRRQFCGLLEELANGINRTADSFRYMPFELRRSAFALMEEWCGYSPNPKKNTERDHPQHGVGQVFQNAGEKHVSASMETEKRDLNIAALSAMAALCAGPMRVMTEKGEALSFDTRRMLSWIDRIFGSDVDKVHAIGQRALYNLVLNNRSTASLLERSIEQCFNPFRQRILQSHFSVLTKVLNSFEDYQLPFWKVLGALIFVLGNDKSEVRVQSARLLQLLERRRDQNSGIQDFDINISDRTTAVYKQAAYDISARLSLTHQEFTFHIFSLFCKHFRSVDKDVQRQMVFSILPWVQVIELQIDTNDKPTSQSSMVLANLLEITFKTSSLLHNEVQALWQALATGHPGNVQLVLDFVISLCSERKDQAVVFYAKQVIVYMAHGAAGAKVVEFLLLKITPKNMVFSHKESLPLAGDGGGLPYLADLAEILPNVNRTDSFALGHLAVVFLVDLIVKPMTVKSEHVPLLLHVIFVLWDNQVSLVQEQARELLVHLVHELVITKIPEASQDLYTSRKTKVEGFVDAVRHHDSSVVWQYRERAAKYEEWTAEGDLKEDYRVPTSMPKVTSQVLDIFSIVYPDIRDKLARVSLNWGTSCPVRHAACRSLQVFRCVLVPIDRAMLSDILARISNTIVHEAGDVQAFSMEMLTTVKCIIAAMEPVELLRFPYLFWATCACLGTVIEKEFLAAIGMLDNVLPKLNLDDPAVIRILEGSRPAKWQGHFEGLTPLVYKGLKSESSLATSLRVLDKLVALPKNDLVGSQPHLLFVTLAHLPRFLQTFEDGMGASDCLHSADILSAVAASEDKAEIAHILHAFCQGGFQDGGKFLSNMLASLRNTYFPMWEMRVLIFVIGLLTNKLHWYKMQALEIVRVLITHVDTHRSEISEYGPDLISPLLRLLQTDFCPQAIAILDHITVMSDTPLTKQHMRMSMTGLGSRSMHVRKEYEKTQSLYGIPEETGWSVPVPAVHASTTRANMQLIYQECANPSVPATEAEPTPEIEFHPEEEHDPSYFGLERSDTLATQETVVETSTEGGVSDLLTKLNDLDDFFDESIDMDHQGSARYSNLTVTPYYSDPDARAEIYDQETAPMLQRSLARTASISSIHSQVAERTKPPVMNPTAFTSPGTSSTSATRPALHSRSVTSPANNMVRANHNMSGNLSDEDRDEAILSEDERSIGHLAANDSRLLGNIAMRKGSSTVRKNGPRADGREARQNSLSRAQSRSQGRSPVPKVPEAYLVRRQ